MSIVTLCNCWPIFFRWLCSPTEEDHPTEPLLVPLSSIVDEVQPAKKSKRSKKEKKRKKEKKEKEKKEKKESALTHIEKLEPTETDELLTPHIVDKPT
jgi:hypothetical protein